MLRQISQLEHVVKDKIFRFVCDQDAPIEFIKEALFQMQKFVGQVEDAAMAHQKMVEDAKAPVPESESEPQAEPEAEKVIPINEGEAHVNTEQ